MKFDKTIITKEFEVLNTSLKQVLENANTKKIDLNGPSPESFQKQLFDSN
jgi:ribosomal protein S10